jgi:hypothetical protein
MRAQRDDAVQVPGEVDDDAVIDGLAALRSAAAARRDDAARVTANRQRPQRLVHGSRHHHARRNDLVERGVGRVAAAAERVEQDLACDLSGQTRDQGAVFSRIRVFSGPRRRHRFHLV